MKEENMQYLIVIVVLIAVILAAGCAGEKQNLINNNDRDKADCIASGGEWGQFGCCGYQSCNYKTTDCDKTCSDSSECQGICYHTYVGNYSKMDPSFNVTGNCSCMKFKYSCYCEIRNGTINRTCSCRD
jgi:hypothetical protein